MDADLQNDPHDIPKLLAALPGRDAVCGWRVDRRDPWTKRIASRVANRVRDRFTRDGVHDTGCTLKAFRREAVQRLHLYRGMHRFLPALLQMEGLRVTEVPVSHRPRETGRLEVRELGPSLGGARRSLRRALDGAAAARATRSRRTGAEPAGRAPGPASAWPWSWPSRPCPSTRTGSGSRRSGTCPSSCGSRRRAAASSSASGSLTFLFLTVNLRAAVRARPPDVFWELEEPLGLPSRVVLEPLLQRLISPVDAVVSILVGLSASSEWQAVLALPERPAVRRGRTRSSSATSPSTCSSSRCGSGRSAGSSPCSLLALALTALVYFLGRVLVLTARGPVITARARAHLLVLLALLLFAKAVDFWLDRYDLLYSQRGRRPRRDLHGRARDAAGARVAGRPRRALRRSPRSSTSSAAAPARSWPASSCWPSGGSAASGRSRRWCSASASLRTPWSRRAPSSPTTSS